VGHRYHDIGMGMEAFYGEMMKHVGSSWLNMGISKKSAGESVGFHGCDRLVNRWRNGWLMIGREKMEGI